MMRWLWKKILINYNLSCRLAIRKQNMKSMVEASAAQILSSKGCIEEETYCYLKRFSMYVSLNKHLWQSAIPCWHAQFYFWCHLNVLILLEKIRCGEWSCIIDVGLGGQQAKRVIFRCSYTLSRDMLAELNGLLEFSLAELNKKNQWLFH